jgi:pimeloyl-ACP methyl ester carboxylesterase
VLRQGVRTEGDRPVLTSAREPQAPESGTRPGDGLSKAKKGLEVAGAITIARPQRAARRRKAVSVKQALRDMRVPQKVKDLLTGPLQELKYALDETDVQERWGNREVRKISIVRAGSDTRHLLYIPSAVLENEDNKEAFGYLQAFFREGAAVYIISPELGYFPHQSFELMVDDWMVYNKLSMVYLINWDYLQKSVRPDTDLNAFAKLFKPPLHRPNGDAALTAQPPAEDHDNAASLTLQKTSTSFQTRTDRATLVTIHGFWSSPETWKRLSTNWQADEQLHGLQIHPFGYDSPKRPHLPFSATRVPDYDDIAQTLATEYTVALADETDIAIVAHSQGGLILQRFLAWMLQQGRGRELARIRSIILLACPNGGSEYLRSIRQILGFGRHPQAGSLEVLDRRVADTQRTVLQSIVNATGVDDHQCRIPLHVYAGSSDQVVAAASAQGAFPGASTLAGDHFSILDPASPGNRTAETVKHHLITDLSAR